MLGQDVLRAAAARDVETVGLTRAELDIADPDACVEAVRSCRPDVVVNCAAWTDVDGAESDEPGAAAVNADGAGNVAAAAAAGDAAIVHVSTDYVFEGTASEPYVESDPVAPQSAYGRTKLAGERAVASACSRHHIVRSAWLFGSAGRNFIATMLRLAEERDEVTVVDDQVGCPTWTAHLAPALVQLARSEEFGTWHVAAGGRCSWNELAREAFDQAGLRCEVRPGRTADLGRPAPRPAWSVLGSERGAPGLPHWREGVAGYLAEVGR